MFLTQTLKFLFLKTHFPVQGNSYYLYGAVSKMCISIQGLKQWGCDGDMGMNTPAHKVKNNAAIISLLQSNCNLAGLRPDLIYESGCWVNIEFFLAFHLK